MASKTPAKTNACRILDSLKIPYELVHYESDDEALDAVTVAHKLGLDPWTVYKTLVCIGTEVPVFVAVVPGPAEIDLKRLASATNNKKVALLPLKDLLTTTGYIRGGCSPLGMKKLFPTFVDVRIRGLEKVSVSPGVRGMQMLLKPEDLIRAAKATIVELAERGGS